MYLKRLQLENYGPLRDLDASFPFGGPNPKPVVFVGGNGSGKTIALSHIVNAMVCAKDSVYHESRESDTGNVFKIRTGTYISVGAEYYFARTDFESQLFAREVRLKKPKHMYEQPPMGASARGGGIWEKEFDREGNDYFESNILEPSLTSTVKDLVSSRCLLYFPSDRTEEPTWLNQANLRAKPQYTVGSRFKGETPRQLIAHSPLRIVHNWLYDVAYDRAVFELHSRSIPVPAVPDTKNQAASLSLLLGYHGDATNAYEMVLIILRTIMPKLTEVAGIRFGIGGRHNRIITLESDQGNLVPNLFQLSSGETALLALFLSIIRDFDLRENREVPFTETQDVRGLVVVDEVDLHLHTRHQFEVLPKLVYMFPQVQFVITTHSPLVVLGMAKLLGDEGFHVYELPGGYRVSPKEFSEFGDAFRVFKETSEFAREVQTMIRQSQRPTLYVEGPTEAKYLRRAAKLLEIKWFTDKIDVQAVGGDGKLRKIWTSLMYLSDTIANTKVLLHDPESEIGEEDKGNIHRRKMPRFGEHPVSKGIENLFEKATLNKARRQHAEFIDIIGPHVRTERGSNMSVPERWRVNEDEKSNLCNWLCEHGESEDFRSFEDVFKILMPLVCKAEPTPGGGGVATETPDDT